MRRSPFWPEKIVIALVVALFIGLAVWFFSKGYP